jgi:hypothetical protein
MADTALEFTVAQSGQPPRKLRVDSDTARVGSGSHCEVRLASEDAAFEQIQLQTRAGGVFAEARSFEPPAFLDGAPFTQGRLLPQSVLCIGRVELRVALVDRHPRAGSARRRTGTRLLYVLGGFGIPLGILLSAPRAPSDGPEWNLEPQVLWADAGASACASDGHGSADALADMLRRQGESARERAPFSPRDGVQAVELLSRAAACYVEAKNERQAKLSRAAAERLKLDLEHQFHVHQVRLERALDSHRYDQAKRETRILLSFAAPRGGAYFDWLSTLERQIDVGFSRTKS